MVVMPIVVAAPPAPAPCRAPAPAPAVIRIIPPRPVVPRVPCPAAPISVRTVIWRRISPSPPVVGGCVHIYVYLCRFGGCIIFYKRLVVRLAHYVGVGKTLDIARVGKRVLAVQRIYRHRVGYLVTAVVFIYITGVVGVHRVQVRPRYVLSYCRISIPGIVNYIHRAIGCSDISVLRSGLLILCLFVRTAGLLISLCFLFSVFRCIVIDVIVIVALGYCCC